MNETLEPSGEVESAVVESTHATRDGLAESIVGYRLHRLEVYNWGTFDEAVHTLTVDGRTALLVGQNGAGKSTLVDALLTLLVRPGKSRNYNLASGAKQTERSEKSYVLGAYERRSQQETNRGEVQYLRPPASGVARHSILLAVFKNALKQRTFTVAQVLYLDGGEVDRVCGFSTEEKSIVGDLAGLKSMDKLPRELARRGFRATKSYPEYFEWIRKNTALRDRAMDMFNQTVAVKDVGGLTNFIRKHMLETRNWNDKVDELFRHFKDLSDAHRELEKVRLQRTHLEPIEKHGHIYRERAGELEELNRLLDASASFFPRRTIELLEPQMAAWLAEQESTVREQQRLHREIALANAECQRLQTELDLAGGERLRLIPHQIERHATAAAMKRTAAERLNRALVTAGIEETIDDAAAFAALRDRLPIRRAEIEAEGRSLEERRDLLIAQRLPYDQERKAAQAELELLRQRRDNLPPAYVEMRRALCESLGLKERDLPYPAEMIAVQPEARDWESSIEMVLRGFALTLLVPERHYVAVSRQIDRTRLRDAQNRGQKLDYTRVLARSRGQSNSSTEPDAASLMHKLAFRENWSPLIAWVKTELLDRGNVRCCETIEEFQQTPGRALTRERHFKQSGTRHVKDDRDRVADPRNYVLGWDNEGKRRRLAEIIESDTARIAAISAQLEVSAAAAAVIQSRLEAIRIAELVQEFSEIDFASEEHEIARLEREREELERNNDAVRGLRQRIVEQQQSMEALQSSRDDALKQEQKLESFLQQAERFTTQCRQQLRQLSDEGVLAAHEDEYLALDELLGQEPLTLDNLTIRPGIISRQLEARQRRLKEELKPVEENVTTAMGKLLNAHPELGSDLSARLSCLDDCLRLLNRIRADDLPKFEGRFKERLNTNVSHEIGILRGNFKSEQIEIQDRIDLLNRSLRKVNYGPGSHMRLVARPVRDRDIDEFRQELDACIAGQFEGTLEADESRFKQIESFLTRLREEDRWRERVTDIRNWFDFAAVETDDQTHAERSYHDDSAGQSGGEKAKLAFTILIAALAFQYNLDPENPDSDRFHFVVVDEMFSRIDDENAAYALTLFRRFGLQLLIVAPLDAKARVTEDFVGCFLQVVKAEQTNRSQVLQMTAREFHEQFDEPEPTPTVRHAIPRK